MARILLIEDSPTDRAVFTQWLERAGHEVLATDNAEDGLQIARTEAPSLVLMDVVLPGMNGFQATRTLARDEATRHIPVILVTTKDQDTDRMWGMRQGARAYITKPFSEHELSEVIERIFSNEEPPAA